MTMPFTSSGSWTILSPIEQSIKRKIEAVGTPLRDWDVRINFGIKTGCNEAFIINGAKRTELISKDPKSAEIIRPILRGRDIKRYAYDFADQYLIVTHNGYTDTHDNRIPPVDIDKYPSVKDHLYKYWDRIAPRTDCGVTPYNLRNCAYMDDFSKQKIVWKRIGSILRFAYDDRGCLSLDSTCMAVGKHAKFITGYLNSLLGNYLLTDSPKTGTGDLLVSVQAIEPIPIPKATESICLPLVEEIVEAANVSNDTSAAENKLDIALFEFFGFSDAEREYITAIVKSLRR
jgi:hypothetical protein